ncbi:hypothetical protein MMC32_003872 [Xylographa parallela]|nr:hypothetical protein [Xylographa parallela]
MVDNREGKRRNRHRSPLTPGNSKASSSNANKRHNKCTIRNGCIQDELGRWGFFDGHHFVRLHPDMFENSLPTTCHNFQLGTLYNVEDCNGAARTSQKTAGSPGSKRSKQNHRRTQSSTDVEEYSIISDTYLEVDEILTHIAPSHRLRELAELAEQYQAFSALCKARIRQTDQVPTRGKVWDKVHLAFVQ